MLSSVSEFNFEVKTRTATKCLSLPLSCVALGSDTQGTHKEQNLLFVRHARGRKLESGVQKNRSIKPKIRWKAKGLPDVWQGQHQVLEVQQAILAACDDKTRRPLTDSVQVLPAVAVDTTIEAQYWIDETNQAIASSIQAAVSQAVEDYKLWQTEQIGRSVNPDELRKRMLNAGASRIDLTSPVYGELDPSQVAQFTSTSVVYQGVG